MDSDRLWYTIVVQAVAAKSGKRQSKEQFQEHTSGDTRGTEGV